MGVCHPEPEAKDPMNWSPARVVFSFSSCVSSFSASFGSWVPSPKHGGAREPKEAFLIRLSSPGGGGLRSYSYSSSRRHIRLLTVERPYSLARRLANKRQSFAQGTFCIRPTVRSWLLCRSLILLYRRGASGTAPTSEALNNSPLCSIARMTLSSLRATATTATLRRAGWPACTRS